ncbi:MAG: PEGA domain-containing protein [Candidatus Brocadiales bacterium]
MSGPGCVTRTLTIKTNPPGAQVFVDDELIGESPVEMEFTYYGTRKITIEKRDSDGRLAYERETVYARVSPPYYQRFPLDFVAEVIVPVDIKDRHVLRFDLRKKKFKPMEEEKDRLLREADELRTRAYSTEVR